ncbi:SWPV1-167 [Shearwaterpox virus]|uniref:SWPV1-167 n=1 Tax=Shearwaterpox virus TaxID=1974596 RepID=A0A1V0S7Z4_CNPV|nr:SWPV1-167 [Shearwaterpox virus]
MTVILILYVIIIFFFLFILTKKSTPVFNQKESIILQNINKQIDEEENTLVTLKGDLLSKEEEFRTLHDLSSSTEFNKYKQLKFIDPYTVMKFTYDLIDRWHLL